MPEGEGLYRAIGRIEGKLASLDEAVRDDRVQGRRDYEKLFARLEIMENQLTEIMEKSTTMQSQIYSNKHGIEGINKDVLTMKMLYSRGLGAWAVIAGVASMVFVGLIWALGHLPELAAAIRAVVSGK